MASPGAMPTTREKTHQVRAVRSRLLGGTVKGRFWGSGSGFGFAPGATLTDKLYRHYLPRPAVETFEEYITGLTRAIEEAQRRGPPALSGQTYPVARGDRVQLVDRVHIEGALQDACPRGVSYLYHYLAVISVSIRDFEAACDHFGLRSVLRDITREEVDAEVRARRGRGEAPSTGYLPLDLAASFSRDEADARIAIVAARIAEARANAAKIPAPATAA